MNIDELKAKRAEIDKQIKEEEERIKNDKIRRTQDKIYRLTDEQKEFILSLMEHGRTSCSDDNPCNGYSYSIESHRCTKCMMMEIFNGEWGGRFDFRITAEIIDNEK